MNSNHTLFSHSSAGAAQRDVAHITGGIKVLLCFLWSMIACPANAENLLVNGDFESGQIAPWLGGELWVDPFTGSCARVGDPSTGDTLSQAVPTEQGKRYLLSGMLRSAELSPSAVTIVAQSQAGIIDGSKGTIAPTDAFHRFTMLFTASSAVTVVEIRSSGLGDYVFIDDVTLAPLPPGADRLCAGMITTTVNVIDPALSAKSVRKVSGQIYADGEMILLDGIHGLITGFISPEGDFSLTLADGTEVAGKGAVRGRRIQLEYIAGRHAAVTFSGAPVANTIKETLTLTRR